MELYDNRRQLHKLAETDRALPKTQAFITDALNTLPCKTEFPWESAVTAFFDLGYGVTTALRADMDALNVNGSAQHVCGHDGHMAMLLEVARLISDGGITPKSDILLIFQPAEETTGGAAPILESGLFEKYNVKNVFGMHLMPGLEKGKLFTKAGALMARSCEITVEIRGKSVHIAKYGKGCDALYASAYFISTLYRQVDSCGIKDKLLRFGMSESGSARNALSDRTMLYGSLRSFSESDHTLLCGIVRSVAADTDNLFGTQTEISLSRGYPPLINDNTLVKHLSSVADIGLIDEPSMLTDDFSEYTKKVPGVYFFLGTGNTEPLHSPDFDFDEQVLRCGVKYYKAILENL